MKVSREDLVERFRLLPDDVLLDKVHAGTLTPLALEVALEELGSRGIQAQAPRDAADASADLDPQGRAAEEQEEPAEPDPDADLVTVARYSNPLEANVLRACLESHGIFAFVWGEHLGTAHIFLS